MSNLNDKQNNQVYTGTYYSIINLFFSIMIKFVFLITQIVYKFINTKDETIYLKNYKLKEITFKKNNSIYAKTILITNEKAENVNKDDLSIENEYLLLLIKYTNEKNEDFEIDITKYLNIINFHELEPCIKKEITREYLKLKNITIDEAIDFEVYGIKNCTYNYVENIDISLHKLY